MAAPSRRKPRRNRESVLRAAARSVEKRRAAKRRWGRLAVLLLGIVAAGAGIVLGGQLVWKRCFAENDYFAVRHVEITTDGSLDADLIREYAGVREGMNLFAARPDAIRDQLLTVAVIAGPSGARADPG